MAKPRAPKSPTKKAHFRHSVKSRKEIKTFPRKERQTVQTMAKPRAFLPFREKDFISGFWNVGGEFSFCFVFLLFEQKKNEKSPNHPLKILLQLLFTFIIPQRQTTNLVKIIPIIIQLRNASLPRLILRRLRIV